MVEGLSVEKIGEVKKNSKLSVAERLMRLYKEERVMKERMKTPRFEDLKNDLDKEILGKKEAREAVSEARDVIDKLKEAYR
ncbi:MAG: hypothetical protein Q8R00_02005 [Candidatus Nanoarchaeia archaeon]|nr:hypothetical protein [Candidatus Nanoarchaeia archaeon]